MGPMIQNLVREMNATRTERGMTWQALSDESGVSKAALCSWASGDRSPNLAAFSRVLTALGLGLTIIK